jgi:hypothetical protein
MSTAGPRSFQRGSSCACLRSCAGSCSRWRCRRTASSVSAESPASPSFFAASIPRDLV